LIEKIAQQKSLMEETYISERTTLLQRGSNAIVDRVISPVVESGTVYGSNEQMEQESFLFMPHSVRSAQFSTVANTPTPFHENEKSQEKKQPIRTKGSFQHVAIPNFSKVSTLSKAGEIDDTAIKDSNLRLLKEMKSTSSWRYKLL
jgi:hypothetical protein